jgi:hypothetical protein
MRPAHFLFVLAGAVLAGAADAAAAPDFPWLSTAPSATVASAFAVPAGYERVLAKSGSFAEWLRELPLRPTTAGVRLYDGRPVADHGAVAAVIDIDVGRGDLQQCADAVMRLRAEYLFSRRLTGLIGFALFTGERYRFAAYAEGMTPVQVGDAIAWQDGPPRDVSHASLRQWLDIVFGFASTRSLVRELRPVDSLADAAVGDVLISPGSPGHAVIIVDLAIDRKNGRLALLAQGSMPARDVHVLRNTADPRLGAWFPLVDGRPLTTPGRVFAPSELRRF